MTPNVIAKMNIKYARLVKETIEIHELSDNIN